MERKYKKFWKDRDIIILSSKPMNQEKFFEEMRNISQKMFGTPNPSIFEKFLIPIGVKNGKTRRESTS